jgi:hypothetical protein
VENFLKVEVVNDNLDSESQLVSVSQIRLVRKPLSSKMFQNTIVDISSEELLVKEQYSSLMNRLKFGFIEINMKLAEGEFIHCAFNTDQIRKVSPSKDGVDFSLIETLYGDTYIVEGSLDNISLMLEKAETEFKQALIEQLN